MTKRKALTFITLVSLILFLQACKKSESSVNLKDEPLSVKDAKEWYYGVLLKREKNATPTVKARTENDPVSLFQTNKGRNPEWKLGKAQQLKDYEFVSFPLKYTGRNVQVPKNLSLAEKERYINAVKTEMLFYRINKGEIRSRIITYQPDVDYLRSKSFDISNNTFGNIDKDYSGLIIVRTADEKIANIWMLKSGRIQKSLKIGKVGSAKKSISETTVLSGSCGWEEVAENYYVYCIGTQQGDVLYIDHCSDPIYNGSDYEYVCEDVFSEGDESCDDPSTAQNECLGGFLGDGGGGDDPVTDDFQQNHAKMCGTYNWGTIGNAWYTQFSTSGFTLVNSRGGLISHIYGSPCIQFSKSNVYTTAQANTAWNNTWNYAVDQVLYSVNHGGPLGDYYLSQKMTTSIKAYLQANYPGATFNKEGCTGSGVPTSTPAYCP